MSDFAIDCGSLCTPIRIQSKTVDKPLGKLDKTEVWIDIGASSPDEVRHKFCEFISTHSTDVVINDADAGRETAIIRLRYDKRINRRCRVVIGDEVWKIAAAENIRRKGAYMQITISRVVTS